MIELCKNGFDIKYGTDEAHVGLRLRPRIAIRGQAVKPSVITTPQLRKRH